MVLSGILELEGGHTCCLLENFQEYYALERELNDSISYIQRRGYK